MFIWCCVGRKLDSGGGFDIFFCFFLLLGVDKWESRGVGSGCCRALADRRPPRFATAIQVNESDDVLQARCYVPGSSLARALHIFLLLFCCWALHILVQASNRPIGHGPFCKSRLGSIVVLSWAGLIKPVNTMEVGLKKKKRQKMKKK
ncbi:hypothetical protein SETIT_3G248000v2 [Setaria italica]|uniref:Uncharacterized protein n=1 Tax=Setaria italica TaxID=4555 RepID=A0A368QIT4_SETIT|nr:hypothetical protein SETIT_3G248000v2 [Setaria italica]